MTVHLRATDFIGGGDGALDKISATTGGLIPGTSTPGPLLPGDTAQVVNITGVWDYVNVQDSRAEASPFTIRSDDTPGTNSWHLVGTTARVGAMSRLTAVEPTTTGVSLVVPWDETLYDDASFWVIGSPTRFTIPVGITEVVLRTGIRFAANANGDRTVTFKKNGTFNFDGRTGFAARAVSSGDHEIALASNPLVGSADYYEVNTNQSSGGNLNILSSDNVFFQITAVGFA